MTRAHQSQAEFNAGYRHGLAGGERPAPDRGKSFYGGWLSGKAERESWTTPSNSDSAVKSGM